MHFNKEKLIIIPLIGLIFLTILSACTSEVQRLPKLHNDENPKELRIQLSASIGMPQTRALTFNTSTNKYTIPAASNGISGNYIKWQVGMRVPIHCILKDKDNTHTIVLEGIGNIYAVDNNGEEVDNPSDTPSQKYAIRFDIHGTKPTGLNLNQGEWYISGIFGGSWDKEHNIARVASPNTLEAGTNKLDIPVAFPWTKITFQGNEPALFDLKVKFRPMGAIVGLQVSSDIDATISLYGIKIQSEAVSNHVGISFAEGPTEGAMPIAQNIDNQNVFSYNLNETSNDPEKLDLLLDRDNKKSPIFYTWLMPISSNNDNKNCTVEFDYRAISRDPLPPKKQYSGDLNHSDESKAIYTLNVNDLISGKTVQIPTKITHSDLMITERYYYQTNGDNYSAVEIYNPTDKPIDLSKYFLIRMRGKNDYHPDGDNRQSSAILLPLYYSANNCPSYRFENFSPDPDHPCWYRYYWGTGDDLNNRRYIQPGKTAVYGAHGYCVAINNGDPSKYFDSDATGVGSCITTYTKDRQIVVAVDNSWHGYTDYNSTNSGVLQLGPTDGVVLVRKLDHNEPVPVGEKEVDSGSARYVFVDSSAPYLTGTNADITNYKNNRNVARYWSSRLDGVIYPTGQTYYSNQWYLSPNVPGDVSSFGARYRYWASSNLDIPAIPEGH